MNESYKTVMTEIDTHYQQSSLEKHLQSKTLKYTNRMLESKLKKLKSLYEKKCAQCEAMKAALTLEQDLYEAEGPITDQFFDPDPFAGVHSKLQRLSDEERSTFSQNAISQTIQILSNVKNYALEGLMTGEIMSHCVEILQQENTSKLFVDWSIVREILKSPDDAAAEQFMDQFQANQYTNWFLVLNDAFHWSLLLYVQDKKAFFHYDSKPNRNHGLAQKVASSLAEYTDSQQLFEVRCSPQLDDHVSGFHVIENITKLLPILDQGRIVVSNVEITLEKISLLKALPLKCRILVLKLYLQKKLQTLNDVLSS